MANQRLVCGGNAVAQNFNITNHTALANSRHSNTTTEANAQITYNVGGTFSNLFFYVSANTINTSASTVLTRKNAATNGNLTVSINAAATGIFEDTVNTDVVTAGEEWCFRIITPNTSGTLTSQLTSCIFAATSNTYNILCVNSINSPIGYVDATTTYDPLVGSLGFAVTAADTTVQTDMMNGGTFKHGFVFVTTNTATVTSTITLRKAAGDGNISISITSDGTGIFEDTVNTDVVTDGDDWNWEVTVPTEAGTNTLTISLISIGYETTDSQTIYPNISPSRTQNFNVTTYYHLSGFQTASTTESNRQLTSRLSNAIGKEMEVNITANTIATSASTLTFRQNATTDSLSVSIAAGATGTMSTTGTTTIAVTDEINYKLVTPNTSGSLTIQQLSSLIDATPPAGGFAYTQGVLIG